MKKIGKLAINAEKVIKNEELVNLRGGYGSYLNGYWQCECGGVTRTYYASTCESAKSAASVDLNCSGTIKCC